MSGLRLYDLAAEWVRVLDLAQEEPPEGVDPIAHSLALSARIDEALAALAPAIEAKLAGCARVLETLDLESDALEVCAERLRARIDSRKAARASLRNYVRQCMERAGLDSMRTDAGTLSLAKGRDSVEIVDLAQLPATYVRQEIVLHADKKALGEALSAGEKVPGARLSRGERVLSIRQPRPKRDREATSPVAAAVPSSPAVPTPPPPPALLSTSAPTVTTTAVVAEVVTPPRAVPVPPAPDKVKEIVSETPAPPDLAGSPAAPSPTEPAPKPRRRRRAVVPVVLPPEEGGERLAIENEPPGGGAHVAGNAQRFGPRHASEGAHPWE